mgnify:CR=1 FL=1|jgi:hypothetical protein
MEGLEVSMYPRGTKVRNLYSKGRTGDGAPNMYLR